MSYASIDYFQKATIALENADYPQLAEAAKEIAKMLPKFSQFDKPLLAIGKRLAEQDAHQADALQILLSVAKRNDTSITTKASVFALVGVVEKMPEEHRLETYLSLSRMSESPLLDEVSVAGLLAYKQPATKLGSEANSAVSHFACKYKYVPQYKPSDMRFEEPPASEKRPEFNFSSMANFESLAAR